MGFLANVIHPAFLLVHGDEQVAGVDNVALAHIDAGIQLDSKSIVFPYVKGHFLVLDAGG